MSGRIAVGAEPGIILERMTLRIVAVAEPSRGAGPAGIMHWKGNVREFRNLIQRLIIHTDGLIINLDSLERTLKPAQNTDDPFRALHEFTEEQVMNELRKRALEIEGGNVAAAARRLDVTPPTLHKWIKKNQPETDLTLRNTLESD